MKQFRSFLSAVPLFLYLLPVFFVVHGFYEGYHLIVIKDGILVLAKYLLIAVLLHGLFLLYFKNSLKAAVVCFFFNEYIFLFLVHFMILSGNI